MSNTEPTHQEGEAEVLAERRSYPRFAIKIRIHYRMMTKHDQLTEFNTTVSHDLSAGGGAIIWDHHLQPGQKLMLKFHLPYHWSQLRENNFRLAAEQDCWPINIMAQVVWSRPTGFSQFAIGLQFLETRQEDAQLLEDFLSKFSLQFAESE